MSRALIHCPVGIIFVLFSRSTGRSIHPSTSKHFHFAVFGPPGVPSEAVLTSRGCCHARLAHSPPAGKRTTTCTRGVDPPRAQFAPTLPAAQASSALGGSGLCCGCCFGCVFVFWSIAHGSSRILRRPCAPIPVSVAVGCVSALSGKYAPTLLRTEVLQPSRQQIRFGDTR